MWDRSRDFTRVKFCEFEALDAAYEAALMGADALGFHLFARHDLAEKVRRFGALLRHLPASAEKVLLTDLELPALRQVLAEVPFDCVQLYPDWPAAEVARLAGRTRRPRLLKVVSARPEENFTPDYAEFFGRYEAVADGFLLDSFRAGGTGRPADWPACAALVRLTPRPVFLAGGLTAANVAEAIRVVRPFGVDVETGVSFRIPGRPLVKSLEKCRAFLDAVTRADRERLRAAETGQDART